MEVDSVQCPPAQPSASAAPSPSTTTTTAPADTKLEGSIEKEDSSEKVIKKKKKKKSSYKSMMASMTQRSKDATSMDKEKEIRKVTGGGTFSKIDKI